MTCRQCTFGAATPSRRALLRKVAFGAHRLFRGAKAPGPRPVAGPGRLKAACLPGGCLSISATLPGTSRCIPSRGSNVATSVQYHRWPAPRDQDEHHSHIGGHAARHPGTGEDYIHDTCMHVCCGSRGDVKLFATIVISDELLHIHVTVMITKCYFRHVPPRSTGFSPAFP